MDSDTFQGSSCHGRGGEVTRGSGYKKDGNIVEYHVNTVDPQKLERTPLVRDLSIQFPRGHDDCIFKQFTMSGKQWWYGPYIQGNLFRVHCAKDDGMGIMISAQLFCYPVLMILFISCTVCTGYHDGSRYIINTE